MIWIKLLKKYLLLCLSESGLSDGLNRNAPSYPVELVRAAHHAFTTEYDYPENRRRYPNRQQRIAEWLVGLPVNIAYMNHDILTLAVAWGSIPLNFTDRQADKIVDNWFNFCAAKLDQLFRASGTSVTKLWDSMP